MKKRFEFGLNEELHNALKAFAEQEGVSMAEICREALSQHLVRASREPDAMEELDDFLSEPYRPEHTPSIDIEFRDTRPSHPSTTERAPYLEFLDQSLSGPFVPRIEHPHRTVSNSLWVDDDNDRWLDEIWA